MWFLLKYWRVLAVAGIVVGALTASYAKGRHDANVAWELRHKDEMIRMYESGKAATNRALTGWRKDLEDINNRPRAPVVRVLRQACPSGTTGGTASAGPAGQPSSVGDGDEAAGVALGREIGEVTADILDNADRQAARCNALIGWFRAVQAGQTK